MCAKDGQWTVQAGRIRMSGWGEKLLCCTAIGATCTRAVMVSTATGDVVCHVKRFRSQKREEIREREWSGTHTGVGRPHESPMLPCRSSLPPSCTIGLLLLLRRAVAGSSSVPCSQSPSSSPRSTAKAERAESSPRHDTPRWILYCGKRDGREDNDWVYSYPCGVGASMPVVRNPAKETPEVAKGKEEDTNLSPVHNTHSAALSSRVLSVLPARSREGTVAYEGSFLPHELAAERCVDEFW
ncbi:hypothetical protein C8R45DRAFT_937467 [Mycena sanguinolenta]|nr:hypothetical protein C8R45DRAFT_937467 [Mycena sanguinolenta]